MPNELLQKVYDLLSALAFNVAVLGLILTLAWIATALVARWGGRGE